MQLKLNAAVAHETLYVHLLKCEGWARDVMAERNQRLSREAEVMDLREKLEFDEMEIAGEQPSLPPNILWLSLPPSPSRSLELWLSACHLHLCLPARVSPSRCFLPPEVLAHSTPLVSLFLLSVTITCITCTFCLLRFSLSCLVCLSMSRNNSWCCLIAGAA